LFSSFAISAIGEACGYAAGPGTALIRLENIEKNRCNYLTAQDLEAVKNLYRKICK